MKVLFRSYELDTAHIIIGNYIKEIDYEKNITRHYIQDDDCIKHEIAEDYLSINFKDMLDSEGTKIFASLSDDGKGGDLLLDEHLSPENFVSIFNRYGLKLKEVLDSPRCVGRKIEHLKAIGIQK